MDQIILGTDSFAENPEPRCPCVLVLDTSGSMSGEAIAQLNVGLRRFRDDLMSDTLAMKRVDVAIITFGPTQLEMPFQTAGSFIPPTLNASGDTPLGGAVQMALELVRQRKVEYRSNGIAYYRPWVFLITDGAPTDQWAPAAAALKEAEASKSVAFFAVGVDGADMAVLNQFGSRGAARLNGFQFREMFQWLSASMSAVSRSAIDAEFIALPAPSGWTRV